MTLVTTTERPLKAGSLMKAQKQFLTAVSLLALNDAGTRPEVGDAVDPRLRVLIVDDHRATADTLFALIQIWGHNVERTYDGATGLVLATAFRPHILLLDMLMPNLDGFEVAMQVRRHDSLNACFIVALTGRTDPKHRAKCYEFGVDLCLLKPFPPSDMQTLLILEAERLRTSERDKVRYELVRKTSSRGVFNDGPRRSMDHQIGRSLATAR